MNISLIKFRSESVNINIYDIAVSVEHISDDKFLAKFICCGNTFQVIIISIDIITATMEVDRIIKGLYMNL
jgi:hypothetical protein